MQNIHFEDVKDSDYAKAFTISELIEIISNIK